MAQDSDIKCQTITISGKISTDNGTFSTDGSGDMSATTYQDSQQTGVVTTLATGNTITIGTGGGNGNTRVTAAAAITGVILSAGTRAGQEHTVTHEGAAGNTITFAAAGTSNVANGASCVITGPSGRKFKWNATTALWYQLT